MLVVADAAVPGHRLPSESPRVVCDARVAHLDLVAVRPHLSGQVRDVQVAYTFRTLRHELTLSLEA